MDAEARRKILEALASDEQTSTSGRLRALDMLDKLDGAPESDPDWALFKELQSMSEEEAEALGARLTTGPCRDDDDEFWVEVEKRAELRTIEATAELRQEAHRLRTALAEAESRLAPSKPAEPLRELADLNDRRQAASEAPSASGAAPIVVPDGVEVGVGWRTPGSGSKRKSGLS
jgi:hypothetical protein